MMKLISLMFAGAIGTLVRYLLYGFVAPIGSTAIPIGTILVNLLGCFVIGVIVGLSPEKMNPDLKLYIMVGFCGALTTFSTFILEISNLLKDGNAWKALFYLLISVIIGFVIFRMGFSLAEQTS